MSDERDKRKKKDTAADVPPPAVSRNLREPRKKPAEETDTISLLDLMSEAAGEPKRPAPDDQATPTGPPIPAIVPRAKPKSPPPPLVPPDRTIASPPPQRDPEATQVQPRVAFPGHTDLEHRPEKPPAGNAPTQQVPPTTHQAPPPTTRRRQPPQRHVAPPRRPEQVTPRRERVDAWPQSVSVAQSSARPRRRSRGSCLLRFIFSGLLMLIGAFLLGMAGTVIAYAAIARTLPSPTELEGRVSTFETAIIYDRDGRELYSLADPNTGNRTYVPLAEISPHLINATIATEDARFYSNPGFDPIGIARAVVQAAQEREIVSGASTITQQLVRAVLLEEEERTEITFRRKVREIVLAAELNRTYPGREGKDKILELYLNEIYYGNLAYGIEAAAQTYYDKPASELTLSEASLLAGLPQSPANYDPFTAPEIVLGRQSQVLSLMVQEGYISQAEAQQALDESTEVVRNLTPPQVVIRHPHFVVTVLQELENQFGAQAIYQGGLRVYTTLDPAAQELAEQALAEHRENARTLGANNGALVALRPDSGEILALVGSFDFNDEEIRGQVNMALAPRQPGSSIKPLVYLAALEQGWTPATLIWDVETEFPNGANPPYVPKNFDDEFHGPQLLRFALGNSYNIPAVKALEFVGVCQFIGNMQKLALTSLLDVGCLETGQPRESGLSLALGGREIAPLDMAAAFATLANEGLYAQPHTINRIENSRGELLFEYQAADPAGRQVVRPAHAFLLSDILSDDAARRAEFGTNSLLEIAGHQVAAKTGTSGSSADDVRDGWTIGYTPQVVTAVWVGDTDARALAPQASGYRLAAPIWNQFMTRYLADKAVTPFTQPMSVVAQEICADSGTRPGADCGNRRTEFFAADQPPLDSERSFIQRVPIDLWTHQVANAFCPDAVYEASFVSLLVSGRPDVIQRETLNARQWVEETEAGRQWAAARNIGLPLRLPPAESCDESTVRAVAEIHSPAPNAPVEGVVEITGRADAPNFTGYQLQYGLTHNPGGWGAITERRPEPVNGLLGTWDSTVLRNGGPISIRLLVFGPDNPYTAESDPVTLEVRVPLNLLLPTATPTTTPTPTASPSPSPSPTPTGTATVTPSVTPTPSPDAELPPTETPTPEGYP